MFVAPRRGRDNLEKATVGIQKTDKSAALEQLINTMFIAGTVPDDDNAQPAHTIPRHHCRLAFHAAWTTHPQRNHRGRSAVDSLLHIDTCRSPSTSSTSPVNQDDA